MFQDIIKRKKAEFSKIEKEIDSRVGTATGDGKGKDEEISRQGTPANSDNDSQVEAKPQGQYFIVIK